MSSQVAPPSSCGGFEVASAAELPRVSEWIHAVISRQSVVDTTAPFEELVRVWGNLIPQWEANEQVSREEVSFKDRKAELANLFGGGNPEKQAVAAVET